MADLVLSHVGKVYDDGTRAVRDLNVEISDGEFVVFVGPSGCGKTTALRMVAGLETITEGEIRIGGRIVNDVPPRDRDVAMVFQSYALYPHLSVRDNIGFGLQLRKVPKAELNRRVEEAADILGLREQLDRKPRNLSGGQRQRVAMGRAIVRNPQAFLMDEPLSNLDAKLRVQMRAEIGRLQRDLNVTTIYVTHDQTEAMTLGHRVAVIKLGVLQQIAPPQELYDRPTNIFVAGFIGSPAMNFLGGRLQVDDRGSYSLALGQHVLAVPATVAAARPGLAAFQDQEVVIGIRPEDVEDAAIAGKVEGRTLPARAELVEPLGADVLVHLAIDAPPPTEHEDFAELARDLGEDLPGPAAGSSMVARFSSRSTLDVGDDVLVTIDTERLHFFAPHTGVAIWESA
ncbi:MAG TPA: sn-glycerol-3-phosphate ABC transporter ATP-binding protein UgpC [Mycobacteriales bacterium]|nr:sn-glycerol-3-phosphate ABC transporter ATP-binding protein UgpC [Mycobacteriales bacterium]